MISLDMKYTALYWALRFVENALDTHVKRYGDYEITIHAEKQRADYGRRICMESEVCGDLTRHKDFVILECMDRLLKKSVKPERITLSRREGKPDITVDNIAVFCERWGGDFENAAKTFSGKSDLEYAALYTSRLVSGLLEYKSVICNGGKKYNYGLFEDEADLKKPRLYAAKTAEIEWGENIADFEIFENELVAYNGTAKIVCVPEGITAIGASAFWNNTTAEEIVLPESLKRIGGDAFYYCTNLEKINIPRSVWIMGNNPFAGCPKLINIKNDSPHFVLENGVLYDKGKTNLIHYTIAKREKEFVVPDGIICVGKHSFFACDNLEKITIPCSVIRFENNPFSGCERLTLDNSSPHYIVENGVIYNKFKTTIIGVLNNSKMDYFVVPETVTLISRNSFWNCKKIKKVVITKNVKIIGYNPFAGCEALTLESRNPNVIMSEGLLTNKDGTEILCCTNIRAKHGVKLQNGVRSINRSAFSGCMDLTEIDFNGVEFIDKNAFTNCTGLTELYIPDTVKYIGEWAFSYCANLKTVSVGSGAKIDRNAFNECPAKITTRGQEMENKYSVFGVNSSLIIEGDNLAVLHALKKDYAGKIDVMPIDPPYNTEVSHIKYKDAQFKNGWQEFMRPRIEMAYTLLSATGIMFIHIDENELFVLSTLCKEIFGSGNVNILVWKKVNERFDENRIEKPTTTVRRAHEYIVVCYKDKARTTFNKIKQPVFENDKWTEREQYLESIIDGLGTTASAKDELQELFGSHEVFSTPKPMRLIKEFVRAASNTNTVVLDFFAGSGTTGHAVMDLNKEDGGKRKFILVTNNESNICREVTIPRIQKAILRYGYTDKFKVIYENRSQ